MYNLGSVCIPAISQPLPLCPFYTNKLLPLEEVSTNKLPV